MINVLFKTNSYIKFFSVNGHANSDEYGSDLVCAGVSSIVFGLVNTLDKNMVNIQINKNEVKIIVNKKDKKTQIILEALYISLKTMEKKNKKYLRIGETKWN